MKEIRERKKKKKKALVLLSEMVESELSFGPKEEEKKKNDFLEFFSYFNQKMFEIS